MPAPGDQFFAEKPLRPFVSGAAAENRGFFWCADEAGAAAKAVAKAAAYAKASDAKGVAAKFADEWPVLTTADVVVAGGGTCGSPAAIAAARAGAKVVLCEFYFNLGGTQTTGLLGKYWDGNRVGFTAEIDAGVEKLGSILNQTKAEYYRQEIVKAGGTVLYGTRVVGAVIEGEDAKGRPLVRGVKVVTADGTVDAATTNVWDKGYTSAICYGSRFSIKDEAIIALAKAKYAPFGPKLAEMMKSLPDDAPYSHLRAIAIYLDAVPEKACAPELARILKTVKGHAQLFDDGNMPKFPKKQIHPQARELMTARALYRLGDADGLAKGVLESYLNDPVKIMADFARRALGCE